MAICAIVLFTACGGSGDTPTGTTAGTPGGGTPTGSGNVISYDGVIDTGLKGGVITLVANPVATGTIKVAGEAEVALTGTYNVSTGIFTMSGGAFSVVAAVDADHAFGTVAVRGQLGTGSMAAFATNGALAITKWCGVTNGTSVSGVDLAVQGGKVIGVQQGAASGLAVLGSATAIDVAFSWVPGPNQTGNASGKITGTVMNGAWSNSFGGNGSWTASAAGCQ